MDRRLQRLKGILRKMKRVIVAYSGGVDSTFLLYIAKSVLGKKNVLAVTAVSESYPASERIEAQRLARRLSVVHRLIKTDEMKNSDFARNPVDRCYYCKKELFGKLNNIARQEGFYYILDGSTLDDIKDIRYGTVAAGEEGVRSPIQEARLKKDDVRRFLKNVGLDSWDKPSAACLASRFAYNQKITKKGLKRIEDAEDFIKELGFKQLRVRCHGDIARIEVAKEELERFLKKYIREKVAERLKSLGFTYITLDLLGYRTGSMNEELLMK